MLAPFRTPFSAPFSALFRALFRFAAPTILLLACGVARADDVADVQALHRTGQTAAAYAKLDALATARPKDPQLRFVRGVLLAQDRRADEAIAVYQQLSEDYPELPEPYNNVAVLYAERGDAQKARASLELALRMHPGYAVAQRNLGDVYLQLAQQAYADAQRSQPADAALTRKADAVRALLQTASMAAAVR
jgi:Flp pilus assembly protein TadD